MRTHRLAAAYLVCLGAALAHPLPAFGQELDDASVTQARGRFREGVEFYDRGKYEQARVAFLQAYTLNKQPAVLMNLAWACLKSGHPVDAERYFKQFMSEAKDMTDKQISDATDGLNQAQSRIGRVDVAAPNGSTIVLDEADVGTAPLAEPLEVAAGQHKLQARTVDGTSEPQTVHVLAGHKTLVRLGAVAATATPPVAPAKATKAAEPAETPASPAPGAKAAADPAEHDEEEPASKAAEPSPAASPPPPEAPPARRTSLWSPPHNLVPVFVLGGVAVAGVATGIGFLVARQSAQDSHDQNAMVIANELAASGMSSVNCSNPSPAFAAQCNVISKENDEITADAWVGGITLAVGVLSAAGAVVYWMLADKPESTTGSPSTLLVPMVGWNTAGMSFSGSF